MTSPRNEYEQREEGGTIRRLGHFEGPVVHPSELVASEPQEPEVVEEPVEASTGLTKDLFALLLLLAGSIITAVGVGLWWGVAQGVTTLGVLTFLVGFMTALPERSKEADNGGVS